ncbi:MAG: hypothetical protein WB985_03865 [Candidatus Acidiferrales bacterium]
MEVAFLLWYVRSTDTADDDDLLIEVYRAEREANDAVERRKAKRGFAENPWASEIHAHKLGDDSWTEGFFLD